MRRRVELHRVVVDEDQAVRLYRRKFCESVDATLVALDRDHLRGLLREQRSREPAGTRADFHDRGARERAGGAGDASGKIEIEQEVLTERLARGEPVCADHLAQRRKIGDPAQACLP
jgi:hypothetical protein